MLDRGVAAEDDRAIFSGGALAVHITHKSLYLALQIPNVHHRRGAKQTNTPVLMRLLLSLDYLIERPEVLVRVMNVDTYAVAPHTTRPRHPRRMLTRVVFTLLAALWAPGAIQAHGGGIAGARTRAGDLRRDVHAARLPRGRARGCGARRRVHGRARRCCTNPHWPARCQPTGFSPADAIRHWSAEGGHPIEDFAAEDYLTPLPGWVPGAKAISDDGFVSEDRILHPALTMVP